MAIIPERPTIHMVVIPKDGDAEVMTIEEATVHMERGYMQGEFIPYEQAPDFDDEEHARLHGWFPAIRRTIETLEILRKDATND